VLTSFALSPYRKFGLLVRAGLTNDVGALRLEVAALARAWSLMQRVDPNFGTSGDASPPSGVSTYDPELATASSSPAALTPHDQFRSSIDNLLKSNKVVDAFRTVTKACAEGGFKSQQCVELMEQLYAEAGRVETACLRPLLLAALGATLKSVSNETAHSHLEYVSSGRRSSTGDAVKAAYLFCKSIPSDLMSTANPAAKAGTKAATKPSASSKPAIPKAFDRMLAKGREEKAADEAAARAASGAGGGGGAQRGEVVEVEDDSSGDYDSDGDHDEKVQAAEKGTAEPQSTPANATTASTTSTPRRTRDAAAANPAQAAPLEARAAPPAHPGARRSGRAQGWRTMVLIDLISKAPKKRVEASKRANIREESSDTGEDDMLSGDAESELNSDSGGEAEKVDGEEQGGAEL